MNESNSMKATPIFFAFLCMGFGDAIGPFVGLAKEEFNLGHFMSGFIATAGFIMFGLLSVPMGIYQDKKGKKYVLLIGLVVATLGLLIPVVFSLNSFGIFLITVLLLGAGAAILQVAGNPIMRDVSKEGKYSRNLVFAQFIKAIGSLSGPLLPVAAALLFHQDWRIIFPVYVSTLLITIILVALTKIKEIKEEKSSPASLKSCFRLFSKNNYVMAMVMGIFFYVGAEVCLSAYIPEYFKQEFGLGMQDILSMMGINIEALKLAGINLHTLGVLSTGFFFLGLVIGRFLGSVILNWLSPQRFLIVTLFISIFGILSLYFINSQTIAIFAIILIGFGFANIFPLVFSIAIDNMPEHTNELSGLMVTAIVGGAFIPPIKGFVADNSSIMIAFIVPILCLIYISILAFSIANKKRTA